MLGLLLAESFKTLPSGYPVPQCQGGRKRPMITIKFGSNGVVLPKSVVAP